jgi:soluble lytic murein transglycosylase-like protein
MKYNLIVFLSCLTFISFRPLEKPVILTEKQFYIQQLNQSDIIEKIDTINHYYNIDLALLISIVNIESQFKQSATSTVNVNGSKDQGLLQLNNAYFNTPNIYEPLVNITIGIDYFNTCLLKSNGDIKSALYRYNSGNRTNYGQSEKYIKKIMDYYIRLKLDYFEYKGVKNGNN